MKFAQQTTTPQEWLAFKACLQQEAPRRNGNAEE
jgi:hypothetical protein